VVILTGIIINTNDTLNIYYNNVIVKTGNNVTQTLNISKHNNIQFDYDNIQRLRLNYVDNSKLFIESKKITEITSTSGIFNSFIFFKTNNPVSSLISNKPIYNSYIIDKFAFTNPNRPDDNYSQVTNFINYTYYKHTHKKANPLNCQDRSFLRTTNLLNTFVSSNTEKIIYPNLINLNNIIQYSGFNIGTFLICSGSCSESITTLKEYCYMLSSTIKKYRVIFENAKLKTYNYNLFKLQKNIGQTESVNIITIPQTDTVSRNTAYDETINTDLIKMINDANKFIKFR